MSASSKLFNDDQTKKNLPFIVDTTLRLIFIILLIRSALRFVFIMFYALTNTKVPDFLTIFSGSPYEGFFGIEVLLFSLVAAIYFWHTTSLRIKSINNMKRIYSIIIGYAVGIFFQLSWFVSIPFVAFLFPYMREQSNVLANQEMPEILKQLLVVGFTNETNSMVTLIYVLVLMVVAMIMLQVVSGYMFYRVRIHEQLEGLNNEFYIPKFFGHFIKDHNLKKISEWFYNYGRYHEADEIALPDMPLGISVKNNSLYGIPGKDRTLNAMIVGPIGSGKTSAIIMNMINNDLNYFVYYLNNYKYHRKKKNAMLDEDIMGRFLNGITVIEPSGDLAEKAYRLAKAKGIPEDVILYLNPDDPKTKGINIFNQPVDKASSMFIQVIEGFSKNQDEFFKQAQRTHLEQHIFLMKLHDPNKLVGIDDLLQMYNDSNLVVNYRTQLQARYDNEYTAKIQEHIESGADGSPFTFDERSYWTVIENTLAWFNQKYQLADQGRNKSPEVLMEEKYVDMEAEFVKGLRNVLSAVSQSIELRRVLFVDSNFSFDKHLASGGLLIVNTAKGTLSDRSDLLGKFILIAMQNAVFRRKPNISPFHSIYVDEFPDYINEAFTSFPAQSRKYKTNIVTVMQSLDQLRKDFGDPWVGTMMNSLRHKFVFGGVDSEDATRFSSNFGSHIVYERSESASGGSVVDKDLSGVEGERYSEVEVPYLSPGAIMDAKDFQVSVNIVKGANKQEGRLLQANFVDYDEFDVDKYTGYKVDMNAYKIWKRDVNRGRFYQMIGEDLYSIGKDIELEIDKEHNDIEADTTEEVTLKSLFETNKSEAVNETVEDEEVISEDISLADLLNKKSNVKQGSEESEDNQETEILDDEYTDSYMPSEEMFDVNMTDAFEETEAEKSTSSLEKSVIETNLVVDPEEEKDLSTDESIVSEEQEIKPLSNVEKQAQRKKNKVVSESQPSSDGFMSGFIENKEDVHETVVEASSKPEQPVKPKEAPSKAKQPAKTVIDSKKPARRRRRSKDLEEVEENNTSMNQETQSRLKQKKTFDNIPEGFEDMFSEGNSNKEGNKKVEIDMDATLMQSESTKKIDQ